MAEQESKEIVKEELSKIEVAEPIAHNPEAIVEEKFAFNYIKKEDNGNIQASPVVSIVASPK